MEFRSVSPILISCLLLLTVAVGLPQPVVADEGEALAVIDELLINGVTAEVAAVTDLSVLRTAEGQSVPEPGKKGMPLIAGDEIRTGPKTQIILRFFDPQAEVDPQAVDPWLLVDESSVLRIVDQSSVESILGRLFATLKGLFTVLTPQGQLGVEGTEFEVVLGAEGSVEVQVLEGSVEVVPGASGDSGKPASSTTAGKAFWTVKTDPGERPRFKKQLKLSNVCSEKHTFTIEHARQLAWIDFTASEKRFKIPGRGSAEVELQMVVDARRVKPGVYRDNLRLNCSDCLEEKDCLFRSPPLSVAVMVGVEIRRVQPMQRLTLRPGESTPETVAINEPQVRNLLDWTSDLVVQGQPSYVVPQDPPHFASVEERSQAYRSARFAALWDRDPQASADLGRIYNDWGEGKRAIASYQDAASLDPAVGNTADFFAGLSQANRQAGFLDRAQQAAESALERQPTSSRAHVALGNVWEERATVAENGGDFTAAAKDLDRSLLSYAEALRIAKSAGSSREGRRAESLAATYAARSRRKLAGFATAEGDETRAERLLGDAAAEAQAARATDPENPFALIQQGEIDQDRARLATKAGRQAASQKALDDAERSYRAALELHPDLAIAHYRLGTVWEDRGPEHREQAIAAYQRSIRTQPTYSLAYYRLGTLKQADDPRAARRYLDVYRKLTPDALEKKPPMSDFTGQDLFVARAAIERQGLRLVEVVKSPDSATPGMIIDQEPKAGAPVAEGAGVKLVIAVPQGPFAMPDMVGLSEAEARGRLFTYGLESGNTKEKVDNSRTTEVVTQQNPKAGKKISVGDSVDLVLAVPKGTKVPSLVGETRKVAEKKLNKRQLRIGQVAQEASCQAAGTVLRQTPDKGRRLPEDSAVNLVLAALGPNPRPVPKLVGASGSQASQLLEQVGLGVSILYQESERQEGSVLGQDPRPDTRLPPGCPVQITLAKPIPLVEVPRLVGLNFADVQRAFRSGSGILAFFKAGNVRQIETRQVAAGTVTRQDPPAGSRVRKGTRINLEVAARPVTTAKPGVIQQQEDTRVTVPNLRCQYVEKATSTLQRLGLRSAFKGKGEFVIQQSLAAGAGVPAGSTVTLVVGGREQCYTPYG